MGFRALSPISLGCTDTAWEGLSSNGWCWRESWLCPPIPGEFPVPGIHFQGFCSAGVVTLLSDYEVCKEGDVLTPEQARVLVSNTAALLPDTK